MNIRSRKRQQTVTPENWQNFEDLLFTVESVCVSEGVGEREKPSNEDPSGYFERENWDHSFPSVCCRDERLRSLKQHLCRYWWGNNVPIFKGDREITNNIPVLKAHFEKSEMVHRMHYPPLHTHHLCGAYVASSGPTSSSVNACRHHPSSSLACIVHTTSECFPGPLRHRKTHAVRGGPPLLRDTQV